MATCPSCGSEVPPPGRFCAVCGRPQVADSASAIDAGASAADAPPQPIRASPPSAAQPPAWAQTIAASPPPRAQPAWSSPPPQAEGTTPPPLAGAAPGPPSKPRRSNALPILLALLAIVALVAAAALFFGPKLIGDARSQKTELPVAAASPTHTSSAPLPTATDAPPLVTERPSSPASSGPGPAATDLFEGTSKVVFSLYPSTDSCGVRGTITSVSRGQGGDLHIIGLFRNTLRGADTLTIIEKLDGAEIWNENLDQGGIDCFDYSVGLADEDVGSHVFIYEVNGKVEAQAAIAIK